ncbi:DUF6207 family protein [Streptomyces sp. FXY-T5]|uniref:DUF6207 family protein n=1 Tax=Streptomyces sp. FXY-T5 TaxID=3064901 RepID=UPI0027D22BE9|nr:DUF6207 family protein [Streptomyces sp. FXY-T5]WMD06392.1 DUF6207 family protein [Streptomyces sp. FXY-T5]
MGPIHETHVSEPGLFVVDVAAADDATALAFQQLLADRWATATAEQSTRDAGQAGVRLRCYLDLRQQLTAAAVVGPTMEPIKVSMGGSWWLVWPDAPGCGVWRVSGLAGLVGGGRREVAALRERES